MKSNLIKRVLLTAATMTTLGTVAPSIATPVAAPKTPTKTALADSYEQKRSSFLDVYKDLNLDFEGDFPAIYWDHGNIAAPGGVKLNPNQTIKVQKITSINGALIPVVSYKTKDKQNMSQMAEGILPSAYKGQFKIELVSLKVGTLNKSNIPAYGDTSFTNTVYYVPSAQRTQYHDDAIKEHLKIAEDLFGVSRFYSLPLARQVAIVDMIYPLKNKFKDSKFGKAVLAKDWNGPNADEPTLTNKQVAIREAWASKAEQNKRRHLARKLLLEWGDESLSRKDLPKIYKEVAQTLPAGEHQLAQYVEDVLEANVKENEQHILVHVAQKSVMKGK